MKQKEDFAREMKPLKASQNKGARIVNENKKTDPLNILKDQVSHYKGFSYFMTAAPRWISKYHMLFKNA